MRINGDGSCAPRTRGWTVRPRLLEERVEVCPAHAGMDRSATTPLRHQGSVPRARGMDLSNR